MPRVLWHEKGHLALPVKEPCRLEDEPARRIEALDELDGARGGIECMDAAAMSDR